MLVGKHVTLTHLRHEDLDQLLAWINSPDLVRLNAPYRPVHQSAHEEWFTSLEKDPSRVVLAIRSRPGNALIGVVQLVDVHPVHRSAEMRIRIGSRRHLGRGLGTEALRLVLDFAWHDLNLHRVTAQVFSDNGRALGSYKKAGFAEEGRMREAAFINGAWTDIVVMGALNPKR